MSNGSRLPEIEGTGARLLSGNKIWALSQAIIGPLVVAGVIWLVTDRNRAWTTIESLEDELTIHEIEGQRRHDIINRRFEQKRKELDELNDGWRECQLAQQRIWIELAKLPPEEWKRQINENSKNITILQSRNRE